MNRLARCLLWGTACAAGFISGAASAHTDGVRAPPDLLERIGFSQNLGAQVPLDLTFRDAHDRKLSLREALDGKPVVLVPGYFACANLCSTVRAGVSHAVAQSGLVPGGAFNVVLVSIDPRDTPVTARTAQRSDASAHPDAGVERWSYLSGPQNESAALMDAIGFRYFYDARNDEYAHAAGIVLLTPQGKVAQYLLGVEFAGRTLRLSLVDASQGAIGSVVDRLLLMCSHYDASTGRYSLTIQRVLQLLGALTVLALIGWIMLLRRGDAQRGG